MPTETGTEVTPEEVITLPPSDEPFNPGAVPVLLDLVTDRLRSYVSEAASENEPISLLGFAMELIYQTGFQDAGGRKRR